MDTKQKGLLFNFAIFSGLILFVTSILHFWMMDIKTNVPVVQQKSEKEKPTVFFGVISRYSPRQIYQGYQPFMDYLTEKTPFKFELRLSRNYQETVQQLVNGKVDFASLGNYIYIQANRDHSIDCIAKPYYKNGKAEFTEKIIVHRDSQIQSINDLVGCSFAFPSKKSFSFWMTKFIFQKHHITLDDLAYWENLDHHNLVVEEIIKGNFSAGTVKDLVAQNYLNKGIRVLYQTQPIPGVPLVVAPHVSDEKTQLVQNVLLKMKLEIEAGDLITFGWDEEVAHGFALAIDSDYDIGRTILTRLNQLEQINK